MRIEPDCIPCILRMALSLLRKRPIGEKTIREWYLDILHIPSLQGRNWELTSPEIIEGIMKKIGECTGDSDPFLADRVGLNQTMSRLYPMVKGWVDNAPDPLFTAVKLAVLGNAIDFMVPEGTKDIETALRAKMDHPIGADAYRAFSEHLKKSRRLIYLADNAGEIVLDKLLIETIMKQYDQEIVFVVRSKPTLNDVTMKDAEAMGMEDLARVIENGIDGPLPGTLLERCSGEVRACFERADLIISKGGGNFDCLEEERNSLGAPIAFMLLSKCRPYEHYFHVPLGRPILACFDFRRQTS
jgi:uncharacterized protein with ATP-grasp and redox domains